MRHLYMPFVVLKTKMYMDWGAFYITQLSCIEKKNIVNLLYISGLYLLYFHSYLTIILYKM